MVSSVVEEPVGESRSWAGSAAACGLQGRREPALLLQLGRRTTAVKARGRGLHTVRSRAPSLRPVAPLSVGPLKHPPHRAGAAHVRDSAKGREGRQQPPAPSPAVRSVSLNRTTPSCRCSPSGNRKLYVSRNKLILTTFSDLTPPLSEKQPTKQKANVTPASCFEHYKEIKLTC